MRPCISLIVVIMVLSVTMPSLVNCRVLASQENPTRQPENNQIQFSPTSVILNEKANTEDINVSNDRVLIGSQVNTMSSGPSRRGSVLVLCTACQCLLISDVSSCSWGFSSSPGGYV
ncbi:hypothetical protein VNO78_08128 [Psophocarpus tetragonolobus]|uniref:Secreted protein n=1 Tax=Psophocarpus tetragonolobus TaxID=3891 RepID=A0AAN9SWM6_PSOTE